MNLALSFSRGLVVVTEQASAKFYLAVEEVGQRLAAARAVPFERSKRHFQFKEDRYDVTRIARESYADSIYELLWKKKEELLVEFPRLAECLVELSPIFSSSIPEEEGPERGFYQGLLQIRTWLDECIFRAGSLALPKAISDAVIAERIAA